MSLSREAIRVGHYHPETPQSYRWAIRWQYPHPTESSFVSALARCAALADDENLARIALGWPDLAFAVKAWRTIPGWAQECERWCESKAALEHSLAADRARDQRATGPSPEEERLARGLDEEQGIYRARD